MKIKKKKLTIGGGRPKKKNKKVRQAPTNSAELTEQLNQDITDCSKDGDKILFDIRGGPILLAPEERMCGGCHLPEGMPDAVVKLVKKGKVCGAVLKNGKFCLSEQVTETKSGPPFRCRRHPFGMSLGHDSERPDQIEELRKNYKYALSHGFYRKGLTDEEKIVAQEHLTIESLDSEIAMTKIRLRRAYEAELAQQDAIMDNKVDDLGYFLFEVNKESGINEGGAFQKTSRKRKIIDWSVNIDKLINQLQKMQALKITMEGGILLTDEQRADKMRTFLDEIVNEVKEDE